MRSGVPLAGLNSRIPPATVTSPLPDSACPPPAATRRYWAELTSAGRRAALAAEPRAVQVGAAVAAKLLRRLRGRERMTAGLAELAGAAFIAAGRAHASRLIAVVDVPCPVLCLD